MADPKTTEPYPYTSASGQPVTRMTRFAFRLWMYVVLLTLVVSLGFFVFDKFYTAFTGN